MTMSIGYILGFIAVIFYGALPIIVKKGSLGDIPPFSFISAAMFVLFCLSSIAAYFYEKKIPLTDYTLPQWRILLLFGVMNFIAFALFVLAVQKIPVPHYQFLSIISIFVGIILSYFFLNEPLKPSFFIGGSLVACGLYIALFK